MMNDMEIWKDIEGYPNYQVSNMGRVKSLNYKRTGKEKIMKSYNDGGYEIVSLSNDGNGKTKLIHRLVASAFIPNPDNLPEVNHINEIKSDNRVENLEWCDRKYNSNHGTRIERISERNKIRIIQFTKEGEFVRKWDSASQVERELGINQGNISMCCKGKRKSVGGFIWHYHYKSIWERKHIPLIEQDKRNKKRVA